MAPPFDDLSELAEFDDELNIVTFLMLPFAPDQYMAPPSPSSAVTS